MKLGSFITWVRWIGFFLLLVIVSIVSATTAVRISDRNEQRATATQRALEFQIQQTQTMQSYEAQLELQRELEKELANFDKSITLTAHVEDCISSKECGPFWTSWAKKALVIDVVNNKNQQMLVEWPPLQVSCGEYPNDEIKPNGGSARFLCNAFERPTLDSIDYIRKVCVSFTATIMKPNDANAEICTDVINIP
jgi:hypothetical protein